MSFAEDLEIDPNGLDVEWMQQPVRFYQIAEEAAEAKRDMERAKLNVDVVEAELDNDIRTNPMKYGIAKITEGAISSAIKVHDDYKKAHNAYIDAIYKNQMCQSAVTAMDQRKRALENLVFLHGQSYFAGPKVPRDIEEQYAKGKDKMNVRRRVTTSINEE